MRDRNGELQGVPTKKKVKNEAEGETEKGGVTMD